MKRIRDAIFKGAVTCYHSRKVRIAGLLVLIAALLTALTGEVSSSLTIEVTNPGLPRPLCQGDFCAIPSLPR